MLQLLCLSSQIRKQRHKYTNTKCTPLKCLPMCSSMAARVFPSASLRLLLCLLLPPGGRVTSHHGRPSRSNPPFQNFDKTNFSPLKQRLTLLKVLILAKHYSHVLFSEHKEWELNKNKEKRYCSTWHFKNCPLLHPFLPFCAFVENFRCDPKVIPWNREELKRAEGRPVKLAWASRQCSGKHCQCPRIQATLKLANLFTPFRTCCGDVSLKTWRDGG